MLTLSGCSMVSRERVKLKDLEMTILSKEYLYICIGYGKQDTGGYSIAVDELYQTEDAIYISTSLLGPGETEKGATAPSYPYIVVRVENLKLPVIFE